MTAGDILRRARRLGVQVALRQDRLRLTAPGKPPDDLLADLREHKAEIIIFLSYRPSKGAEAIKAGLQLPTAAAPPPTTV
jgi:hypothetical protein